MVVKRNKSFFLTWKKVPLFFRNINRRVTHDSFITNMCIICILYFCFYVSSLSRKYFFLSLSLISLWPYTNIHGSCEIPISELNFEAKNPRIPSIQAETLAKRGISLSQGLFIRKQGVTPIVKTRFPRFQITPSRPKYNHES